VTKVLKKTMKKLIILLMAVSIMLTSCGKSAGLSNRNKGADNNTPSASSSFKGNLPQITDGKNSIIQPLTGFVNEYKTAIAFTAVAAVIVVGAFFVRKWIINNKFFEKLKPLPEFLPEYKFNHDIEFFTQQIDDENHDNSNWLSWNDLDLIYIYQHPQVLLIFKDCAKKELKRRGYKCALPHQVEVELQP
jgi:hypothetical protein